MRNPYQVWLASALMAAAGAGFAQAPAPAAPAGMQTFVCKDGTTVSAATSQGACKGHKGIDKAATAQPSAAQPAAAQPATAPAPAAAPVEAGKVWANEGSKVYHCPGDRYYGKTKNGSYMTEAEAKAKGMHASRNKECAS